MSIINPNSGLSNSLNTSALGKNELSQESFMKLLLTQLKMQNPLNPFDASTMMQQMSQLTGLSATQELAKTVDSFKSGLGTSQVLEASMLVGKEVQVRSQTLQLNSAHEGKGSVMVPQGVESIEVSVLDASGNTVKTLKLNAPGEGLLDFSWDGLDEKGNTMEPGFYSFSAKGLVGDQAVPLATAAAMKVNSVALDRNSGIVILNVDGLGGVSMSDVVKIM
jgi:flagellar basal-body rod modification protein FlgD